MSASLGAWPERTGTRFAIWSDKAADVHVHIRRPGGEGKHSSEVTLQLARTEANVFVGFAEAVRPGAEYTVLLDGEPAVDPYARCLPHGVHGPASVVPRLAKRAHPKRLIDFARNEVLYELHIGTFTPEGTFASASARLPHLVELGVTVIEMMPIAAFPGQRGWGYDGVALFAPFCKYGSLDELVRFIDRAHELGLAVVLDVVYNHLGPDGNYLPKFSDLYFDSGRQNPWGTAPALEKPAFRRLILDNARYWLEEVGFDGLRLDAVHELEPGGDPHILRELAGIAKSCSPPAVLIAEDDRNHPGQLLEHGIDAVWSDDFHHAVHVLLTSERDGYYRAYSGDLAELARVIERGQLYEGQIFPVTGEPRGAPSDRVPRERLIYALQNHDQIGNRAHGERLHMLCEKRLADAVTLLLYFLPATPLVFMGQEWRSDTPFLYFTDHAGELGRAVTQGRYDEFGHFAAYQHGGPPVPDPQAPETFERSKLRWDLSAEQRNTLTLHRRALQLRRTDEVLGLHAEVRAGVTGTVLWVRLVGAAGERLLLLNIGERSRVSGIPGVSPARYSPLLSTTEARVSAHAFELEPKSAVILARID